ncbi:MAG TPA: methylamine dehydrogenase accessory protein MauD [Actinomycetota bacterium]|nr:methylamine dehydrogenase accessory protein MauD [Actinomycetota bacterium]
MQGWWVASYVMLWFLVIALSVIVVALARQVGTLHLRLGPRGALEMDDEGPPIGEAPVPLETPDEKGREVRIGGPGTGQLLLFVSPNCMVCDQVLPALRAVASATDLEPYVLTDAVADDVQTLIAKSPGAPIVSSPEAARLYEVPGTPYAVVLDELGVVRAKGTVNNLEQVEGLVDTARRRKAV